MARKQKHEEHENHERWLISYADFITLLFAFFVVMYSISSINEGKYRVLSDALVAAFRNAPQSLKPIQVGEFARSPVNTSSTAIRNPNVLEVPNFPVLRTRDDPAATITQGDAERVQKEMKRMTKAIEQAMESLIAKDLISVRSSTSWVEVEIKTSILFPSGSARFSAEAIPILEKLAEILRPFPNTIQVEGFTDNVPISTAAFPSNWELSAGRAASVVHLFARSGVDPRRMAAIGFAEYRPVADNGTEEGRSKNRRVVLVILAQPQDQQSLQLEQAANGGDAAAQPLPEPPGASAGADATAPANGEQAAPESGRAGVAKPAEAKPFQAIEPPIRLPAPVAAPAKPIQSPVVNEGRRAP